MEDDLNYRNIGTGDAEKIEDQKRVITGAGNAKKKGDSIKQRGTGDVKKSGDLKMGIIGAGNAKKKNYLKGKWNWYVKEEKD